MNKKTVIGVVIVIVALLVWWMVSNKQAAAPTTATDSMETSDIATFEAELNGLGEASLSQEFQGIDAGIDQL